MLIKIVVMILETLFKNLDIEDIKDFIDGGLDRIEDRHPDNPILNASISGIRKVLDIKDELYGIDKSEQEEAGSK